MNSKTYKKRCNVENNFRKTNATKKYVKKVISKSIDFDWQDNINPQTGNILNDWSVLLTPSVVNAYQPEEDYVIDDFQIRALFKSVEGAPVVVRMIIFQMKDYTLPTATNIIESTGQGPNAFLRKDRPDVRILSDRVFTLTDNNPIQIKNFRVKKMSNLKSSNRTYNTNLPYVLLVGDRAATNYPTYNLTTLVKFHEI